MVGKEFGRLTVLSEFKKHNGKRNITFLRCRCVCGNVKDINAQHVKRGNTISCGCFNKERVIEAKSSHGMFGTSFYNCWINMIKRCDYINGEDFIHYGGRGITVCERWRSFENFHKDMYESYLVHIKEHGDHNTSFIRIQVNGNYDPDNVRWATQSAQNTDRRTRNNSSGVTGVSLLNNGNWMVRIKGNYIGVFKNKNDAIIARKDAEVKYDYKRGETID
jgi:hypothetical protein